MLIPLFTDKKTAPFSSQFFTYIVLLVILTGLPGCMAPVPEQIRPPADLVWPTGNEIPRIQLVGSISRPEDFQITQNVFEHFWGYLVGNEDNTLVAPYNVTMDDNNRLYVVDTFRKRIQRYDAAANEFHAFPKDEQLMTSPIDITVNDSSGLIYVVDSKEGIIKLFDGPMDTTPQVIGQDLLQRPTGIAINHTSDELLVVDTKLSRIFRFNLHNHLLKGEFGSKGIKKGQFNHPTNIAVAGDGTIIITDALNFRIQTFSAKGEFLRTFGSAGDSPGHFSRPRGVATDSDGNIYVVDALFDNVQMFDNQGRLLMDFGTSGREYGEFWLPAGIYIDKNDRIYVADSYNKRVQIFQYLKQDDLVQ
jgi:DNA-binding beta-propeller fold protein YncE